MNKPLNIQQLNKPTTIAFASALLLLAILVINKLTCNCASLCSCLACFCCK